jgi:hypothetical protein
LIHRDHFRVSAMPIIGSINHSNDPAIAGTSNRQLYRLNPLNQFSVAE